jgi:hypothetical protein
LGNLSILSFAPEIASQSSPPSAIGEEIYDIWIMTNRGVLRIAVLGSDIATNPYDDSN